MELNIRKYGNAAIVQLKLDNGVIDLGVLDNKELISLKQQVQNMLDDLDWITDATTS